MDTLQLIKARLNEAGYDSVLDFFRAHPGEPYGKMLRTVAKKVPERNRLDIPMFALRQAHLREAIDRDVLRDYAKDTLTRSLLEHLGKGWNRGKNWRTRCANAFVYWATPPDAESECEKIWHTLEELPPPDGWRPSPVDDELINKAFAVGWPE